MSDTTKEQIPTGTTESISSTEPISSTGSTSPADRPGGTALLGRHVVGRLGYGAMGLERLANDPQAAISVVRRAIERGVNHIDTAQFYGNGFVNDILRRSIGADDDVLIVSKVGATPDPGAPRPLRTAQRPAELRAEVEANLSTLGLDMIPVVNLRRMDVGPGVAATGEQVVDLDDQLEMMIKLRDEGKIGAIGLSSVNADILRRALPVGIVCVQNAYNALSRECESILELCQREEIAWVPFFPLGSGFSGFDRVTDDPTVRSIAERLGVSTSQVALAWLLGHSPNTLLIPGTADPDHLDDNVAAGELVLDADAVAAIDRIGVESIARGPQPPVWPGETH